MAELIYCTCSENPLCIKCDGRGYYYSQERTSKSISLDPYKKTKAPKSKNSKPEPDHYIACPICKNNLLNNRFRKHFKQCLKRYKKQKKIGTIKNRVIKKGYDNPNKLPIPTIKSNPYRSESHLDCSYGLHVARENGRFGSYSAHDNYNDESMP